ncbi:hypothetical protein BGZ59_004042 [Podila verticillata]|nr:hypothetical protein BGZ59_004042 [Podila verticillata]
MSSITNRRRPKMASTRTETALQRTRLTASSSVSTTALASASAFAPASVSAPLLQDGASGFDQLSLLDEACSSGLNTPFTPQMDTPDQTPSQTPMIDCVASDDLASLDLFWTSSPVTVDAPVASTSSVDDASRLQAENALLDFVLFDDIAPTSPISTFSTPMTASITSPSVDLKEFETHELAMQLAASANMASSTVISPTASPFVCGSSDVIGSLFSDASLTSPLSDTTAFSTPAVSPISPPQPFVSQAQDWISTSMNQSFLFDFGVTSIPTMASQPDMVNTTPSPSVDLNLLLSLYSQQASGLMPLSAATMLTSTPVPASTAASANPLKRKSDEIQASQAGEESPRQFACAQCGRAFSRLFNLNTHERTHDRSKARLFACPEQGCKKSFTRKNDLQRHQISIHKVTHIYSCKNCNTPFQRKDALRRHLDECSVVASSSSSDHEHVHAHDHHSHPN